MGRKKKVEFTLNQIKVDFDCSVCGKQEVVVSAYDFHYGEQECELCGSHGSLSVDIKCPHCGSSGEIEIDSF